jgi:transcriptional regulator with XRE-family HTH domain
MELKKYRRIAGLSQTQLAKKSGVDVTLISRLERGERQRASYESIVRLARALNLEPEELSPVELGSKPSRPVAEDAKRSA